MKGAQRRRKPMSPEVDFLSSQDKIRPTSRGMKLRIRRAEPGDAKALAELFQCTYRNSSHPFQTFEGVSAFLSDSRNYQIIAEDNGRIISSMAMTYYPWNSSYELGRALTDPEYRGSGLAAT